MLGALWRCAHVETFCAEEPKVRAPLYWFVTPMQTFDMIVLGSGPAGQRAAIQAAKSGKRVAVVEKREVVGGTCINSGTIPSKTLREAVLHLSGFAYQSL